MSDQEEIAYSTVRVGETVAGKFVVESILGVGGMGIVALATHKQLDERVALKFLRRDALTRDDVIDRFSREGRAAVKLKSEFVARVTDVGMHHDIPFMVMEYLEGEDLRAYIDRGTLSVVEACEFMIQVCEGLGEAHARGIVHRDMKPENIFVVARAGERMVKILDFGISKVALTNRITDVETRGPTQGVMGSPYYMSPEQLRSTKDVDHRSDIWSLGAVLFEMLAGDTAFSDTQEFTELLAEILERPHRNILNLRRDVPPELAAVIDRCLAKDRNKRYQSTGELAVDLAPFVRTAARNIASRAVAIANAAGLSKDLEVHDYMTEASLSQMPLTLHPPAVRLSNTSDRGAVALSARPPAPKSFNYWLLVPPVALMIGIAVFFGVKASGGQPATGVQPVQTQVAVDPLVRTTATATESAQLVPSATATLAGTTRKGVPYVRVGGKPPPVQPSVAPRTQGGLDIRRER